jgi:hypothetical protein
MGLLDKLTGTAKPEDGVTARPPEDVLAALRAVGEGDVPFVVRETDEEGADLVGEYDFEEPVWNTAMRARQVDRSHKVFMRLDPEEHEVRFVQKDYSVSWRAGMAELSVRKEGSRGTGRTVSFGKTVGGDGEAGDWHFDTEQLVDPLRQAALDNGWTWKGVSFGKL